jgi:hypothetical protein
MKDYGFNDSHCWGLGDVIVGSKIEMIKVV